MSQLFDSFKIKDLQIRNRITMPPMCMYSAAKDGLVNSWHLTHYETRAIGGTGLILIEATAVESRGRISDSDLGIWHDAQTKGLFQLTETVKKHGSKIGIQLAHAGRKCTAPDEDIIAPSPINFDENDDSYATPREMTKEDIKEVIRSYGKAAERALQCDFDIIEIHGAHGYLINEFLSPVTNKRKDEYGGNPENRVRLLKEITQEVKKVWPAEKPIMLRVTAKDYHPEGNNPEDVANLINMVKEEGIDIINVSSGGVIPAPVPSFEGYQIKFAEIIRILTGLPVLAGGKISSPSMANEIIQNERADLVYLGRELLRNPYWPLHASKYLNTEIDYWPDQYERSR